MTQKAKPILFSGPMVRSILEGRKMQTRRVIKPQPGGLWDPRPKDFRPGDQLMGPNGKVITSPYQLHDRLWVRETWAACPTLNLVKPSELPKDTKIFYRATYSNDSHFVWRPSIFMPRWASRITLEVTNVRVERVQDISFKDAREEGVSIPTEEGKLLFRLTGNFPPHDYWPVKTWDEMRVRPAFEVDLLRSEFASLWDGLNHKRGFGWDRNPWVWVYEFRNLTGWLANLDEKPDGKYHVRLFSSPEFQYLVQKEKGAWYFTDGIGMRDKMEYPEEIIEVEACGQS